MKARTFICCCHQNDQMCYEHNIFIKFVNMLGIHHKIDYFDRTKNGRDGLFIDHIPFDETHECSPGGLYYTSVGKHQKWTKYGGLIYFVYVPTGAQYIKEYNGKWKASKFILSKSFNSQTMLPQLMEGHHTIEYKNFIFDNMKIDMREDFKKFCDFLDDKPHIINFEKINKVNDALIKLIEQKHIKVLIDYELQPEINLLIEKFKEFSIKFPHLISNNETFQKYFSMLLLFEKKSEVKFINLVNIPNAPYKFKFRNDMTCDELVAWMSERGDLLSKNAIHFSTNHIDGNLFSTMVDCELIELGIIGEFARKMLIIRRDQDMNKIKI